MRSGQPTTIENVSRVTSEKRRCIIGEDLVPPQDLVIEILGRLPVKSLARFLLVSKLWSTIIRDQDFIRSFPVKSPSIRPQPPRLLFALNGLDYGNGKYNWQFYSDEEKNPVLYSLSRINCQFQKQYSVFDAHYVNGLISLGYGQQQIISNPSTGKSIILPLVESRNMITKTYFGYDPINYQYKVLCMSAQVNEHQVFTLEGEDVEKSWRMIECNILHRPITNGVCIDGVLYYGALSSTPIRMLLEWRLMKFDVRTEKLDLLSLLKENVQSDHWLSCSPSLINYKGKLTLAFETSLHTFDLWVMEDAEKWSKVSFSIHPWRDLFDNDSLRIIGTIHTGDIIFVPYSPLRRGVAICSIVYYDHEKNELRLRKVGLDIGNRLVESSFMVPSLNYVESSMWL